MLTATRRALLGTARWPTFRFDDTQLTFTEGMAKRPTSVFAAAPIAQGAWDSTGTPDELSYVRGTLLENQSQLWYSAFDPYQGTIVFWVTPEWDGDDGLSHYLWWGGSFWYIRKLGTNALRFRAGGQNVEVDVSAWAAGTTYCVVCSWDTKATIDGTNYLRLSIDDVHTYGGTTQPTSLTMASTSFIGSISTPANSADAIIEGLTIYRRPLWDGAYGKDVGNGDETAAIYAAGAGADPCLTTGSWDAVFCMPTDATPGALVTGTGEAWSHPHGSALPTHAFADDGGYYSEPWAVFYDGTDTDIDCGSGASLDDLPNLANGFQAEIWVRADDWGEANTGHLLSKYVGDLSGGWMWGFDSANGLFSWVFNLTTDSLTYTGTDDFTPDGKWHHFLLSFHHVDQGGDSRIYMAIDGVWVAAYTTQNAGVGAFQSDAAVNFHIGNSSPAPSHTQEGCVGWVAIWNDVTQYPVGTDFVPTRTAPAPGGNLQEAWHIDEGTGVNVAAQVTSPGNDGTIANIGAWERQWEVEATPIIPQSVAMTSGDIDFGSGVNIDDLPPAGFTAEGWFRCDEPTGAIAYLFSKGNVFLNGWSIYISTTDTLGATIWYAGGNAALTTSINLADGVWHHVALVDDGVNTGYLYLDGIEVDSDTYAGAYVVDNARVCVAGDFYSKNRPFNGGVGWLRVRNDEYYTANFTPPDRQNPPANDGNTQLLVNMDDGAGTTATDTSGNAYHGTITAGRWDNTYDQTLDSPGAGAFQNGYVIGADGANDGIGHLADVTAETDYAIRAILSPGQDSRGAWFIRVWDDIGGAQIGADYAMPTYHGTHTAGNNQADLTDANARFPQSLVGATVYNITDGSSGTITAISGDMQTVTAALAGGTDNDWDTGDVYRITWSEGYHFHPWCEPFVIRTPAGCTRMDVRILSSDGEGTLYVHQVEVQESLVDNGDIEAALVGAPPIPPLWVNDGLDAGDTQAEAAIVHSGAQSIRFNVGATAAEEAYVAADVGADGFACIGSWAHTAGRMTGRGAARYVHQATAATVFTVNQSGSAFWEHLIGVVRRSTAAGVVQLTGLAAQFYMDDVYLVALDDVSLTATPASEANSAESGGIRVDGTDVGDQPMASLRGANRGRILFKITQRHDPATVATFNTEAYLFDMYEDANNYLRLYWSAANTLRLAYNAQGAGEQGANYNAVGETWAATEISIEVRYDGNSARLYIDNALASTVAGAVAFAAAPSNAINWGHRQDGTRQIDAVLENP